MTAFGTFDVDDSDRLSTYRYVDRHGPVEPRTVAEAVGIDPESFRHHLSILKRDGYLEEVDGTKQWRFGADSAVYAGIVIDDDTAYVGTSDNTVYAVPLDE